MSTEENKAIARRLIDEVWTKGRLEVIDELIADDFVTTVVGAPEPALTLTHVTPSGTDPTLIQGVAMRQGALASAPVISSAFPERFPFGSLPKHGFTLSRAGNSPYAAPKLESIHLRNCRSLGDRARRATKSFNGCWRSLRDS